MGGLAPEFGLGDVVVVICWINSVSFGCSTWTGSGSCPFGRVWSYLHQAQAQNQVRPAVNYEAADLPVRLLFF